MKFLRLFDIHKYIIHICPFLNLVRNFWSGVYLVAGLPQCTEVRFASFLSGGLITAIGDLKIIFRIHIHKNGISIRDYS